MDLEQYKQAWKNQEEETSVSQIDIYKMAHKRSSSIVKWIFIISIIEFLLLTFLTIFYNDEKINLTINHKSGISHQQQMHPNFIMIAEIISYCIVIYFSILFYKNYKRISVVNNTKTLMDKILKVRKTVKTYIIVNLSTAFMLGMGSMIYLILKQEVKGDKIAAYIITLLITLIIILVVIGLGYLFYQLIYGILLKKLNKNYKELSNLDD